MKPLCQSFRRRVLTIGSNVCLISLVGTQIVDACSMDRFVSRERLHKGLIATVVGCDKKQEGDAWSLLCTKDRQEDANLFNAYMQFCDKESERNARRLNQQRLDT